MTRDAPGNCAGRILRVKRGYNPNSSSVGSDIPAFLYSAGALTILGAIATQVHDLIIKTFRKNSKDNKSPKQGHGQ